MHLGVTYIEDYATRTKGYYTAVIPAFDLGISPITLKELLQDEKASSSELSWMRGVSCSMGTVRVWCYQGTDQVDVERFLASFIRDHAEQVSHTEATTRRLSALTADNSVRHDTHQQPIKHHTATPRQGSRSRGRKIYVPKGTTRVEIDYHLEENSPYVTLHYY